MFYLGYYKHNGYLTFHGLTFGVLMKSFVIVIYYFFRLTSFKPCGIPCISLWGGRIVVLLTLHNRIK